MEKKKVGIKFWLIFFVMILMTGEVFILNRHSTIGDELTHINKKISEIEKENDIISQKVASASSIAYISQQAKQYGLASSSKILSLGTPLPLAASIALSL